MNRSLSIPEWCKLAQTGAAPPVRIQLMGVSMAPLIRYMRDYVTVGPVDGSILVGDIVLFFDSSRELYVMHRVWKLQNDQILTWGDNCTKPDGWLSRDAILGKALLIERGKRKIVVQPRKGLRWAAFWHHAGKVYRICGRMKEKIPQGIKKPIKRLLGR